MTEIGLEPVLDKEREGERARKANCPPNQHEYDWYVQVGLNARQVG